MSSICQVVVGRIATVLEELEAAGERAKDRDQSDFLTRSLRIKPAGSWFRRLRCLVRLRMSKIYCQYCKDVVASRNLWKQNWATVMVDVKWVDWSRSVRTRKS